MTTGFELPYVTLADAATVASDRPETVQRPSAPAAGAPRPAGSPGAGDAPADGSADAPADGPADAAADAPADSAVDGARVLVLPDAPLRIRPPAWMRIWLTGCHWAVIAAAGAARAIRRPGGPWHASPESMAGHDTYRRTRAWIPHDDKGHQIGGGILGPAGAAYHWTLGSLGMLIGYGIAWTFARPMRLAIAAIIIGIPLGIWLG